MSEYTQEKIEIIEKDFRPYTEDDYLDSVMIQHHTLAKQLLSSVKENEKLNDLLEDKVIASFKEAARDAVVVRLKERLEVCKDAMNHATDASVGNREAIAILEAALATLRGKE